MTGVLCSGSPFVTLPSPVGCLQGRACPQEPPAPNGAGTGWCVSGQEGALLETWRIPQQGQGTLLVVAPLIPRRLLQVSAHAAAAGLGLLPETAK